MNVAEFRDSFEVVTEHVVAIGLVHNEAIFISLRGTRLFSLPDWLIDLHTRRTPAIVNDKPVYFHTGFYQHITECIEKIAEEVNKRQFKSPLPVYVAGHSLGGAMAAILYGLDGCIFSSYHRYGSEISVNMNIKSSYTYGMPRYGNNQTVDQLRAPFCIFHKNDIVPTVPLKSFGYADAKTSFRYRLHNDGTLEKVDKDHWRRLSLYHHLMDGYISKLGKTVQIE